MYVLGVLRMRVSAFSSMTYDVNKTWIFQKSHRGGHRKNWVFFFFFHGILPKNVHYIILNVLMCLNSSKKQNPFFHLRCSLNYTYFLGFYQAIWSAFQMAVTSHYGYPSIADGKGDAWSQPQRDRSSHHRVTLPRLDETCNKNTTQYNMLQHACICHQWFTWADHTLPRSHQNSNNCIRSCKISHSLRTCYSWKATHNCVCVDIGLHSINSKKYM